MNLNFKHHNEGATLAEKLGIKQKRATEFDILTKELCRRKMAISEIMEYVWRALKPTSEEWTAYCFGLGLLLGKNKRK